jgi:NTE family protein
MISRNGPFSPRIGLALGGGGARGLAHVGVLQALEDHNVRIDLICGTSMGAIIGALYAQEPDAHALRTKVLDLLESGILKDSGVKLIERLEKIAKAKVIGPPAERIVRLYRVYQHATRDHLIQDEAIREGLSSVFEDQRIEDLQIPFATVAVDLITGERVIFDRGPVRKAVLASASIPGVFPPVQERERRLVDGAVLSLVPINAAYALGSDLVIAVDVSPVLDPNAKLHAASDILLRCEDITARAFNAIRLADADFVLTPLHTDSSWSDFSRSQDFIAAGYSGTLGGMEDLKRTLGFPNNLLRILKRKLLGRKHWVDGPVPTSVESFPDV